MPTNVSPTKPCLVCRCEECPLQGRPFVPSELPEHFDPNKPTLWIVGEAPGYQEAEEGRPFIGRSGQLLRKVIAETGLDRLCNLVITNACLCHPEGNATPKKEAIEACRPHFDELPKPDFIIACGSTAARALGLKVSVMKERGNVFETPYGRTMVVLHPAAVLRRRENIFLAEFKAQFQKVRQLLFGISPDKDLEIDYHVPKTREELRELVGRMLSAAEQGYTISFDYETFPIEWETTPDLQAFGLNLYHPWTGISTVGFAWREGNKIVAFAVPVDAVDQLERLITDQEKLYREIFGKSPEELTDKTVEKVRSTAQKVQEKGTAPKRLPAELRLPLEKIDYQNLLLPSTVEVAKKELEEFRKLPSLSKEFLKKFLSNPEIKKLGHNVTFERKVTKRFLGVDLQGVVLDTQLLAYLLDESRAGGGGLGYSLASLVSTYLPQWEGYKKKFLKENLLVYNALDAGVTLLLARALMATLDTRLPVEKKLIPNALKFLLEASELIADMELGGVNLAYDELEAARKRVKEALTKVLANIKQLVGTDEVTKKSFKTVFYSLYEHEPITTEKGDLSLSSSAIKEVLSKTSNEKLKKLCVYLLTFNKLRKIETAYLDAYPKLVNRYSGKIHPSFHLTGTATGRLSSSKPNFQQVPKNPIKICPECTAMPVGDEEVCPICGNTNLVEVVHLKKLIKGGKGQKIVAVDYSQMEVCVLADQSGDEGLKKAIADGLDLHSYTASKIFGIPYEEIKAKKETDPVIKKKRQAAKAVTFGILYGQTPQGLAEKIGVTVEEAEQIIEQFYQQFPKVREWVRRVHNTVRKYKLVWTPVGRFRRFVVINSEALRQAQNFPIQSFASDITLSAAIEVNRQLKKLGGARVIGLVHDSIVIEADEDKVEEVKKLLDHYCLVYPREKWNLSVPLKIDYDIAETWK